HADRELRHRAEPRPRPSAGAAAGRGRGDVRGEALRHEDRGGRMSVDPLSSGASKRLSALAASVEPLSRLVSLSRAIGAEHVSHRMLRAASRELTSLLDAEACLVSELEDGLLREVADYAGSARQVARGLSYYLSDYPTTEAVLESRIPCSISADDP